MTRLTTARGLTTLRIAAEHYAMAPQQDAGRPGALRELAESLVDQPVWEIGWP